MALGECCISERKGLKDNPILRWNCSQIETEEEEESLQEGDQMAEQWEEEQHLEGILVRRRMEGKHLSPIQRWDCSQIENEEEEESWQEGDQMAETKRKRSNIWKAL